MPLNDKSIFVHSGCGGQVVLVEVDAGGVPFTWGCLKCEHLWDFMEKPTDIVKMRFKKFLFWTWALKTPMTASACDQTTVGRGEVHAPGYYQAILEKVKEATHATEGTGR